MKTYELASNDSKAKYFIGSASLILGVLFNFAETWYFGWNSKPSCPAEMLCDYISHIMVISGFLIVFYVNIFHKDGERP